MFVVVVQSPRLTAQHAILAVRQADGFIVLDNLSGNLRKASEIDDYKPMFSVNPRGFWIHGFPTTRQVASADRSSTTAR